MGLLDEIETFTPKRSRHTPKELIRPPLLSNSNFSNANWKLVPLYLILLFLFAVLLFRAFQLQIINGVTNREASLGNSIKYSYLRAPRGVIYDRNGLVLVRNKPTFSIELITNQCVPTCLDVISQVAKLVSVNLPLVYEKLDVGASQITLATNLTRDDMLKVEAKVLRLPGIVTQTDPIRDYLNPESIAHVIGYVSADDKGDVYGKTGLEAQYESYLHGKAGSKLIQINSAGTLFDQISSKSPVAGKSVYLNIDKNLQDEAFLALKKAIDKPANALKTNNATGGAVVALDPNTGGVLALVSYPSFDINLFTLGISQSDYDYLSKNPNKPFFNRAVSAVYPPGSTFKLITSLAALDSKVITEDTLVDCPSSIRLGTFVFRDWYAGGRGPINVKRALQVSCDTFYYTVAGGFGGFKGMGIDPLATWAKKLGLAKATGLDLAGESSGTIPDPVWKEKTLNEQWYLGDTYNTSIGQGNILTTPLQVAQMTAFFASNGKIYKPKLIRAIEGEQRIEPELVYENKEVSKYISIIKEGMELVVNPGGTAYPFFDFSQKHNGIKLAGKTGTAEFGTSDSDVTHAWFTIFGPVDNANIVLTVVLEGGGGGSSDAAPIAREILDVWFK